jgi:hypothetical protein
VKLDHEDIEAIAQRVVALQREQPVVFKTQDVLTRAEAMAYVKKPGRSAFHDWCKTWHVHPSIRGRYSRQRLDIALEREARKSA